MVITAGSTISHIISSENEQFFVERDATLTLVDVVSKKRMQSSVTVELQGEGASVNIFTLYIGNEAAEFVIDHQVRHSAPRTTSQMTARGVLNDKAVAKYHGCISIPHGIPQCVGNETIDTLLLSEKARVEAIPELLIANNDVKCSHAVTTTSINEEKKFFLASRGMSDEEAKELIIRAHVVPILDRISDEVVKGDIEMELLKLV